MSSAGSFSTLTFSPQAFDLVDPALLIPPDVPIRGGSRPDAAVVVDRELVKLAGVEGYARTIQAHLVARMMAMRGWQSLGFVRLSDYARERLGLASRTLEEDAFVVRSLATLPRLRAAVESQTLSWTKLRMLVRAATTANEEELLSATAEMTTRALEIFLKDRSSRSDTAMDEAMDTAADTAAESSADARTSANTDKKQITVAPSPTPAGSDLLDEVLEDPPSADTLDTRWDITVSLSGRRMWRMATELAQRSAGTPLSQADVLELVCAEAISGRSTSSTEKRWIPEADAIQARLRSRHRRAELPAQRFLEAFRAETGVVEGFAWLEGMNGKPGPARTLDHLLDGVADPLRAGTDATNFEDLSSGELNRGETDSDVRNSDVTDRGEIHAAGCAAGDLVDGAPNDNAHSPVDARTTICPGDFEPVTPDATTDVDAFELDRRLRELRFAMQRVDAQMASLLRIGADRRLFRELGFATVKLYVESRLGFSSRKAWSLIAIERASWRCCPALREAWRIGQISHLAASALLPVLSERHGHAWVQRASEVTLRRLHDEVAWALDHGDRHPTLEPPAPPTADANVRADTAGDVSTEDVQMRAYDPARADTSMGPSGPVRLTFRVPLAVAALAETTLWLLVRDSEPRWRTFERIVALAILEWSSQPRHRDPVFERDGWRCAVPACSSRRNLHDHHVVFRSKGGDNARDNRVTVCASHHLHGIHEGRVRAYGRAPDEIVWELGCRRGETPLMRLRGDCVLAG